jgi:hypothetical protein
VFEVIAGVDDDGQIFRRENLGESMRKFRAADSARKSSDLH